MRPTRLVHQQTTNATHDRVDVEQSNHDRAEIQMEYVPLSLPIDLTLTSKTDIDQQDQSISLRSIDPSDLYASPSFEHPLLLELMQDYRLDEVPRVQLFRRLQRRLEHIRLTIRQMTAVEIDQRLQQKRNSNNGSGHLRLEALFVIVLLKKRERSIESMNNDERLTMAECKSNRCTHSMLFARHFASGIERL
jgi:hypothetical protein